MDLLHAGELLTIGLLGGFMAGFLGVGGGVIIIPLLLYVAGLPVKLTIGISMVQAFFATLSGLVVHRRRRTVNGRLGVTLGATGILGGLIGSFGSALVTAQSLLILYWILVAFSLVLLLFAPRQEKTTVRLVNSWLAGFIGLAVGVLAGMLGVGGGIVMIPLMISVLKIPTRVAVGTSLLVILMITLAGAGGKIATGQFDLTIAALVITGSIIGAQVGGRLSALVSPRVLRTSLSLLLGGIMIRTGIDLLGL